MFLALAEALLFVAIVVVVVTQMIIPLLLDIPIFPVFRKNRKLEKEVSKTNEELEAVQLQQTIIRNKIRAQAYTKKGK